MDFIPHTSSEIDEMLRTIGVRSIADLFAAIPQEFKLDKELALPDAMSEAEVLTYMQKLACRNATTSSVVSFVGGGAYDHYVPAAVHHLLSRGDFYTAYTPYQPEVSQGTLQAQFEYQTMVAGLLGMDVANASMYEGATALAEACLMTGRVTRRPRVLVSRALHPEYRAVLNTYLGPDRLVDLPLADSGETDLAALSDLLSGEIGTVVVQSPNYFGIVEDIRAFAEAAHATGAMMVATFTEPLSFGLIESPGALGADVAAGEGQSLGLPLSFGGPYIGFFAVKASLVKNMPGRLIGRTEDPAGKVCYTLTLAAREQHIRRGNATSNICSNEGLCALAVAIYLSLIGRQGMARLALYNHQRAERLKALLAGVKGVSMPYRGATFNEFVVRLSEPAEMVVNRLAQDGLVPGIAIGRHGVSHANDLLVTVTESVTDADFDRLVRGLT